MRQKNRILPKGQRTLGFWLVLLGVSIFLIKLLSDTLHHTVEEPTLFYISGTGEGISQFPVKAGEIHYNVSFDNPTKRTFQIVSIEPVLTRKGQDILAGGLRPVEEAKRVKPGKEVEFSGTVQVNTSGLTEEEIRGMLPIVEAYRVVFNNHEEVILPVPNVKK